MTVSVAYLTKLRRAVRRNAGTDVDTELTDIIEECRIDLQSLGVIPSKTNDETDSLILGAVRCYVRWKFGLSNEDAALNRDDYMQLRSELPKKRDYAYYSINFSVEDESGDPIDDVSITFNEETKETDENGQAIFYYVGIGTNQTYIIEADGYISQVVDLDVSGEDFVTVIMEAI